MHGGWGGAWSWRDVGKELTRREIPWTALDLPSSTHGAHPNTYLADDAREVVEVAKLDGPVVLVGHSYGGAVITEAADQIPNLERLVYIAALVPALGQSATEAKSEVEIMTPSRRRDRASMATSLCSNPVLAHVALYQDCKEKVAAWAVSQLTPQTVASFRSPRSSFDVDVPSRYILCTNDNAIDPTLQKVMSQRCTEVVTLESDHSPFSVASGCADRPPFREHDLGRREHNVELEAIADFLMKFPETTEEQPFRPDVDVYKVAGKIFAIFSPENTPPSISLKCEPTLALELREEYAAVTPGYHLNKTHWNTVSLDGTVPDHELRKMIAHSYEQVVSAASKDAARKMSELKFDSAP